MLDIELLKMAIERHGHSVTHVVPLAENAGGYEMTVDGNVLTLAQVHALLEEDDARGGVTRGGGTPPV